MIYISLDNINYVEITRFGAQRSFDMIIYLHKGESLEYQFLNIDKQEYDVIIKYLGNKRIKVKTDNSSSAKLMEIDNTISVIIDSSNI